MCEQNENNYLDGDVVWVKLGSCWWPGEVVAPEKLPPDLLPSFRKPPIAVVKFFLEDTYEYVKNYNSIYKYNCSRKNEFINKGLDMYRTKHGHMDKFPEDVIRAETAVGGDIEILTRDEFQEVKKESYAGLFGTPGKRTPASIKKGKGGKGRPSIEASPIHKLKGKSNYKVHILVQPTKSPRQSTESAPSPSTSRAGSEPTETPEKEEKTQLEPQTPVNKTPIASTPGIYACHACNFSTTRLNVLIMHNKSHSTTFSPYTIPTPTPVKKKPTKPKESPQPTTTPKARKPRQPKKEKVPKKQAQKRSAEDASSVELKKSKTDEEIKTSLLADWDDSEEESNDESSTVMPASPEVPIAAESPAVPTPAELPSAQIPADAPPVPEDKEEPPPPQAEKPETSNDAKYEFCEDEDWPVEADIGRKIPRVKNPKRKDEMKSLSIDEDEMAREVAELLNKTTLPELPSAPETFKEEENFPEPSIVKSPDKPVDKPREVPPEKKSTDPPPTKTIFKTKTFFRSRHSRSQDAIGKYVAEQLNAAERMDISESEINGPEIVSLPEPRISPPVEHVKVARLAPKIQLKKMKAEAAQLEREKLNTQKMMEKSCNDILDVAQYFEKSIDNENIHKIENKSHNEIQKSPEMKNLNFLLNKEEQEKKQKEESRLEDNHETAEPNVSVDIVIENKNDVTEEKLEIMETTIEPASSINDTEHEISKDLQVENKLSVPVDDNLYKDGNENKSTPFNSGKVADTESDENATKSPTPYMSESTASAVDALLSVSRETDRVTKIIGDDPPEDLFEDDNKDSRTFNSINGFSNEDHKENEDVERTKTPIAEIKENIDADINNRVDEAEMDSSSIIGNKDIEKDAPIQASEEISTSNQNFATDLDNHDHQDTNHLINESTPSESDLQVAEALINLPTTTSIHNKILIESDINVISKPAKKITLINSTRDENTELIKEDKDKIDEISSPILSDTIPSNNETIISRFETEQEKSENLNAAQSLVQMSESIDHNLNIGEVILKEKETLNINSRSEVTPTNVVEQNVTVSPTKITHISPPKSFSSDTNSSKLLKILEEPCLPKVQNKKTVSKQLIIPTGNEKILNFDVGKSALKAKSPKQKIIIRRATPTKNLLNNMSEMPSADKIILSPSNKPNQEGSSIQTYTIQTTPDLASDNNPIIFQQKIRKITKPVTKLQKVKAQTSFVTKEKRTVKGAVGTDAIFDINSMPVVLSDEILTPESIEKMPIVMSDGNLITNSNNPPKLLKSKQTVIGGDKLPLIKQAANKTETKTLLLNSNNETNKVTTPNILSKSSKLRGAKPMLVIDKTTGKQKIIMTKTEPPPTKEIKQPTTLLQPAAQPPPKTEKFIILPTASSPRHAPSTKTQRTQKIVIDPQTGKAHVLVGKGAETPTVVDNKPVSAKLVSSASENSAAGNTVMIITNAQGAQSRIVLTSEHEKILFPNKQQPNVSQLKPIVHRITPNNNAALKPAVTTATAVKTQTRIVQKPKGAIITSKGQLIVGGRVQTSQNITSLPEIRPAPKRIIASEPKKLVQAIQKNTSEPLIFLQQKNGTVMQLTVAQFEHLQRTGQIVQKVPTQEKIVLQKAIAIPPSDQIPPTIQKQRVRKQVTESITPAKKTKHEMVIAQAPILTPMPTLAPLTHTAAPVVAATSSSTVSGGNFSELDNFEEMLPSTAIARQPEPVPVQPEPAPHPAQPPPAAVSDGQLLAIPGENFGGPPGSFYLCVEDNGTLTPIDNRPLVLENNQLVPMPEPLPALTPQPERRDILEAALANSDVFHAEPTRDDAPDFRDLNANVSVHCRVSETSTTLNQPIMTPVEVPSKRDTEPAVLSNLEDGLAVIGVTPQTVPTSLELPITVTDPRIAPKTTDPLSNNNYGTSLMPSPNTEMTYVTTDETQVSVVGPISMPLLTDEESVGKSMPILTDDVADRTVSSIESAMGSPSSVDVRESETEDGGRWPRRLLTPCSDTSEASTEIPLQPVMQLSVSDISPDS